MWLYTSTWYILGNAKLQPKLRCPPAKVETVNTDLSVKLPPTGCAYKESPMVGLMPSGAATGMWLSGKRDIRKRSKLIAMSQSQLRPRQIIGE